ncbi:MAG: T9SS type A sorting domain-containing protein, partial [Phaeodactylibacter sp.]|nr:T9SS type A sorting domain-containing protein [Phaeodactylibacter sp.]
DDDVVVSDIGMDEILYYENLDGSGAFGTAQFISNAINGKVSLSVADLDADGDLDFLSSASIIDQITCHINQSPTANEIFGEVVLDLDNNGCDENDLAIANMMVIAAGNGGDLGTFTLGSGIYQLFPGAGDFETTLMTAGYFDVNPEAHNTSFSGVGAMEVADFCLAANQEIVDLNVSLYPLTEARPGFDATYQLVFHNDGTEAVNGTVNLEYDDAKLDFLSSSLPADNQTANQLSFNFSELNPFETMAIEFTFNVFAPPVVEIDEVLAFTATVDPDLADANEADNTFAFDQIVIGSFDPNDIRVLEGETIPEDEIPEYLHYIIRFQNTGTASAINVRVENELDPNLDWSSLELESSSHANSVEIRDGNLVSFLFENINLPDSTSNEPESNGYITYRIKPVAGLSVGDIIQNQADIFFDFNLPIETNIATTEIIELVGLDENNQGLRFSVSPNPIIDWLDIHTEEPVVNINLYDGQGRLIYTFGAVNRIDLTNLYPGIYFCQVIGEDGRFGMKKIIK